MPQQNSQSVSSKTIVQTPDEKFDYSYVPNYAQVAVYDDLRSAPRITKIAPAPTSEFINSLATTIYDQAQSLGGLIPFTVVKEVSENFIHARFTEIVVSVFDKGNTIRFADQGPGIPYKEKAQQPGFSSATEPMREYIRGVGSGLPIVKEYLEFSQGAITIEDNMGTGAVITVSMVAAGSRQSNDIVSVRGTDASSYQKYSSCAQNDPFARYPQAPARYMSYESSPAKMAIGALTQKEKDLLSVLLYEGALGVTEISSLMETAVSSSHYRLKKLEEAGLVERMGNAKRVLTPLGKDVAESFL